MGKKFSLFIIYSYKHHLLLKVSNCTRTPIAFRLKELKVNFIFNIILLYNYIYLNNVNNKSNKNYITYVLKNLCKMSQNN